MQWTDNKSSKLLGDFIVRDRSILKKIPVQILFLIAVFIILYIPTFGALIKMWWGSDDYSHGFLVPVISFYLVWIKRKQLSQIEIDPSLWSGVLLVFLAGFMLVASRLGGFAILQELSLLVMIAGLVLLLAGKVLLRNLALPIGYLLFMINLFEEGGDRFHRPFQLLAARIGVGILHLLGFTAYQENTYIQLPNAVLEVAAACSGVRFLVSIIAIGIPLAYLTQRTWQRRIGLVLFAVIIAILANGVRVALIGIWTYKYGTNMIHGPFHIFYGVFVSWVGFIALFGGVWVLGGMNKKEHALFPKDALHIEKLQEHRQKRTLDAISVPWNLPWIIAVVLLMTIGGYTYFHRISSAPLKNGFTEFPFSIGKWYGKNIDPKLETLKVAKADSEMIRTYTLGDHQAVNLYVGYFDSQTEEKKLVTYTTSWKFHRGEMEEKIPIGSEQAYKINRVVLTEGNESRAVLFWYDLNGRVVSNRYMAKLYTIWDALTSGRTNGALVALSVPLDKNSNMEQVVRDQELFFSDIIIPLHSFLYGK